MISPQQYKNLVDEITAACPLLKKGFVVVDDAHLRERIKDFKDADCPFMAAGLPTIDITGAKDANVPYDHIVFFVLKKVDYNNRKYDQEIEDYQECYEAFRQMHEYLKAASDCHLFAQYDGMGMIDPEYNRASCDGYSVSIKLKSTS